MKILESNAVLSKLSPVTKSFRAQAMWPQFLVRVTTGPEGRTNNAGNSAARGHGRHRVAAEAAAAAGGEAGVACSPRSSIDLVSTANRRRLRQAVGDRAVVQVSRLQI